MKTEEIPEMIRANLQHHLVAVPAPRILDRTGTPSVAPRSKLNLCARGPGALAVGMGRPLLQLHPQLSEIPGTSDGVRHFKAP